MSAVLETSVDLRSRAYHDRRSRMLGALAELERALDAARDGGGERAATRQHARGKLLARERIELLVDRDSPLLELSPTAGWGSDTPVGAAVVTAIGVVEGVVCVLIVDDPTLPPDATTGHTLGKIRRATEIALCHRLPLVSLIETAQPHPAGTPGSLLRPAGEVMAGHARLAAAGVPTVAAGFALPDRGRLGVADYTVALRTAAAPAAADQLAEDERDALRLVRHRIRRLRRPSTAPPAATTVIPPRHDPADLLAVPPEEPREILARILDGSEFDEIQPEYATGVCTGWARLHGHPVGIVADCGADVHDGRTPDGHGEATKAVRLVRLAETTGTPVVFLRYGAAAPGPPESALTAAVAGSPVPVVTVRVGGWYGVPGVEATARFRFAWPTARAALAPEDPPAPALQLAGQLDDDAVIDPRDTRTVLGFCLALQAAAERPA